MLCGSISRIWYPRILSRLNAYAWFQEAEHAMFLKLKSWKKVCTFKGAAIFEADQL